MLRTGFLVIETTAVATLPRYPERTTDAMIVEKRNSVAP